MGALEKATLDLIAADLGVEPSALYIEAKVANRPAVFYEAAGSERCACAVGSIYWQERQAAAQTT